MNSKGDNLRPLSLITLLRDLVALSILVRKQIVSANVQAVLALDVAAPTIVYSSLVSHLSIIPG